MHDQVGIRTNPPAPQPIEIRPGDSVNPFGPGPFAIVVKGPAWPKEERKK